MKNIIKLCAFLTVGFINAQQISSNFTTNAEDWMVVGDATSAFPLYVAQGGNTGGYVSADDTAAGGVWYWSAPAKFLGDQSSSFGKTLSFDLKQSSINSQFDTDDIIISNGQITITYDHAYNPGLDWTSYSVVLDTINAWKIDDITSGELATSEQIMTVLSNILSLKIRGEFITGSDTGGLDNVILAKDILTINSFSSTQVRLYPNPTTGILRFSNPKDLTFDKVEVFDLLGKSISTIEIHNAQIDLSSFPTGVYILRLISAEKVLQKKIIKH